MLNIHAMYMVVNFWVQVAGNKDLNDSNARFWAALIPLTEVDRALQSYSWDSNVGTSRPGFIEYGNNEVEYQRFCGTNKEPLAIYREFDGVFENYLEISEEFRLLNNLYHNKEKDIYLAINNNGDTEEVIKVENKCVHIKLNYLIRFTTAKQMAIALFFDIRYKVNGSLSSLKLEAFSRKVKDKNYYAEIWGDEMNLTSASAHVYSVLMGKKILLPKSIEQCGYWPFDKEKTDCESFIIGINEDGAELVFTSNPNYLANYYGANPEAPHYLTPVFFKREVLQKYLSKPELYSVEDGYLRCGTLWGMAIDNHQKEYISAYLGDLGRDLPHEEHAYWRSFNILVDGELSDVKFKRDFCCIFTDAEISDLKFKRVYLDFQEQWKKQKGWEFFLPLSTEDKYNFERLRLPIHDSQEEFDFLILSLVKTLIDSLNEKEIFIKLIDKNNLTGGISKLERWFVESNVQNYEEHIKFLRNLQELRSSGSGHRKGKGYDKISINFGLGCKSFTEVFDEILIKATNFIHFLATL